LQPPRHVKCHRFFRNALLRDPASIKAAVAGVDHHRVETRVRFGIRILGEDNDEQKTNKSSGRFPKA
jgi:hypothetical protein